MLQINILSLVWSKSFATYCSNVRFRCKISCNKKKKKNTKPCAFKKCLLLRQFCFADKYATIFEIIIIFYFC